MDVPLLFLSAFFLSAYILLRRLYWRDGFDVLEILLISVGILLRVSQSLKAICFESLTLESLTLTGIKRS